MPGTGRLRRTDATPELVGDRRRWALTYVLANAFEFWIALTALAAAVTFVLDPAALADSSVGQQAGAYAWMWNALYFFGSGGVLLGLLLPSPRQELAGLALLSAAALVNGVAVIVVRGATGAAASGTYFAFVLAAGMRTYLVWKIAKARELRT